MLWIRRASDGSGQPRFTLQVPVQIGPDHDLTGDDTEVRHGNLSIATSSSGRGPRVVRVEGFATREEAEAFLPLLHGSLLRVAVVRKISLRVDAALQTPHMLEEPTEVLSNSTFGPIAEKAGWTHVDGFVDPSPAVVIPEHLRLMEMGAGAVGVLQSISTADFLGTVQEGVGLPDPAAIVADERLALAVDLYAASFWEQTRRARVVSLTTCLEALLEPADVQPFVADQIDTLLQVLKARASEDFSEDEKAEFERLRSRLSELKSETISRRLRSTVGDSAGELNLTREEAIDGIKQAYGTRSTLLHEGHAPAESIQQAAAWLVTYVPKILEVRVRRATAA